ncbi:site-specific integrase [Nocardia vaccinii]|uniref:site-specific integrase n=1 Tax=Nocardia vaccinii TaxID=1822 RepID=UPI001FDFDFCB|nr:site-specific integrase [Nocardia vaccinii]
MTYTFQVDIGTRPDGTRDRQRFTYPTMAIARREYRRISSELAEGKYVRITRDTVDEACDLWLKGRRAVRKITLEGYKYDLKPVRRHLGGKQLAQLTKADGDGLVEWMLEQGRVGPRHYRLDSLSSRVAAFVAQHPDGIPVREIKTEFPDTDVYTRLSALLRAGRVVRLRRGVYAPPAAPATFEDDTRGLMPITVRSTLTTFGSVVQSYVDQGTLPRNVIALVERPPDLIDRDDEADSKAETAKSWTVAEVEAFRESVRAERLYACWLLSCYGMRRSEVMGLRWKWITDSELRIRRGRVAIGHDTEENLPKTKRSRRDLPLPADVNDALRVLKTRQKAECLAVGIPWSDDRLIAVHEDNTPIRPEWYTDQFHRLRKRAGLRRIHLKGLRNTSVSLMLAQRIPVHIVAAWHGHDPAVSLRIYSDVQLEDLRHAATTLFQ